LAAASPQTDLVEYLTGSSFIDELPETPFQLDAEGCLPIPSTPGLGLRINLDSLAELARVPRAELSDLTP
jgi:hypothetical protein